MNAPAQRGMLKSDVATLLAFIAAYDQRTVGVTDVEAWHLVAARAGWTLDEAREAVVAYYTENDRRIVPAHITKAIREERGTNPWAGIRWIP